MHNAPVLKDVWDQKGLLGLVNEVLLLPAFWSFYPHSLYCKAIPESHTFFT